MAVTLSENEKKALNDMFISLRDKKSFFHKIITGKKKVSAYILKFKREYKRVKKQH